MGLFSSIKKKETIENGIRQYFEMMTAYQPAFTSFEGSLYEMELTRSAIHTFATHVSKLKPVVNGSGNTMLERRLQFKPNPLMDTKKYLYMLATILEVENNAIIAPVYNERLELIGYYPLSLAKSQIIELDGEKYVRYQFGAGNYGCVELSKVGRMTKFQYKNDLFGEGNGPLIPTLNLLSTQIQGMEHGIKNSASLRFIAKLAQVLKQKDIEAERKAFRENNLSSSNNGGVLLFDQKYEDVKQITSQPYIVDDKQMKLIKENVFSYFGTNEKILQNNFTSDEWNAYYEGKIEPFALEASLVHTNMTFTDHEVAFGNQIMFESNRVQYMSNSEKLAMITQLFDRGFLTLNDGLEILHMAPVEDGDKRYIRREYAEIDKLDDGIVQEPMNGSDGEKK